MGFVVYCVNTGWSVVGCRLMVAPLWAVGLDDCIEVVGVCCTGY